MSERKCRENFYPSRFRNKFFSVVSQNSNKVNEKTHVTEMRKVSRIRIRPRRLTIARVMTILFLTIMVKIQRFLSNEYFFVSYKSTFNLK